jgi:phage protein U
MNSTLMILGPFRFSVQTAAPDEITRSSSWDWQAVDRIGLAPALQYTGPQNETMTLTGRLVPGFSGGVEQISRMRELAGIGIALPLVDGTGRVHGLWVIEQLEETGKNHFKDGYPKLISFSLTLKKYGDGTGVFGVLTKVSRAISLFG